MLSNWSFWAWPVHSEASQTETLETEAEKDLLQGPNKEYRQLMLQELQPLDKIQGRVFKGKKRDKVLVSMINSCTILWAVVVEVTKGL